MMKLALKNIVKKRAKYKAPRVNAREMRLFLNKGIFDPKVLNPNKLFAENLS